MKSESKEICIGDSKYIYKSVLLLLSQCDFYFQIQIVIIVM